MRRMSMGIENHNHANGFGVLFFGGNEETH